MFLVWMSPGTGWDPALGPREQRLWPDHADFMDDLHARGLVVLGGPLTDGSGSLVVLRASSADEVRAWFSTDPWSVHDVLPVREVKEWTIYLDGRDAPAG